MSLEKGPFQKESIVFQPSFLIGFLSFRISNQKHPKCQYYLIFAPIFTTFVPTSEAFFFTTEVTRLLATLVLIQCSHIFHCELQGFQRLDSWRCSFVGWSLWNKDEQVVKMIFTTLLFIGVIVNV